MINYLDFKNARCKDCYKCLRECPSKAIKVINHQARIIESRCILCGKCTLVCPQNAKSVHSGIQDVKKLIDSGKKVIASVAPSFVSCLGVSDFGTLKIALGKLGFTDVEETAVGAKAVTEEYVKLLKSGKYKNFITSACPAVNRMIQLLYPDALKYLAPVDSPMVAHAKIIKAKNPSAIVVFIGPCIAKKREAAESGLISGVLTFEELKDLFREKNIVLNDIVKIKGSSDAYLNKARFYPISRGIIKSFDSYIEGYEYVAVDGSNKCKEVLGTIDELSGMFLELNSCEYACVNGPCSTTSSGKSVKSNADIRQYANMPTTGIMPAIPQGLDFSHTYERIRPTERIPSESEIKEILAKTGKTKPEDELNCGACGYSTCREKATAVANGYADIEMCVPYMRERAESMSYEIIQNSPNGIILLDSELRISEINGKAISMLNIESHYTKGLPIYELYDGNEFMEALYEQKNSYAKHVYIKRTDKHIELSVIFLQKQKVLFGVMKDVTEATKSAEQYDKLRTETITTTDEVIKKQMRVAQEIASLLGETTAETKVALLKLKNILKEHSTGEEK